MEKIRNFPSRGEDSVHAGEYTENREGVKSWERGPTGEGRRERIERRMVNDEQKSATCVWQRFSTIGELKPE